MWEMSDVSPREPACPAPLRKLICSHLAAFKQEGGERGEQGWTEVEDDLDYNWFDQG